MIENFKLDKYSIEFNSDIKYEKYSCEWYYGIIFWINEIKYDLIHNKLMGNRLLINEPSGKWQDVPLKLETFWLLPSEIKIN